MLVVTEILCIFVGKNKPAYSRERRVFGNLVTCYESRGLTKHYGGKGKQKY